MEKALRETRACSGCGKEITRRVKASKSERWYCGRSCLGRSMPRVSRGGQISITCAECSTTVTRFRSVVQASQVAFCSNPCKARHQGRQKVAAGTWKRPTRPRLGNEAPCATCGVSVYRYASFPLAKPRYCSDACQNEGQRAVLVDLTCEQCGTITAVVPSKARRRFCNRVCEQAHRTKRSDGRIVNGRPVLITPQGYVTIYMPGHPMASKTGRILEHRLVMQRELGRMLTRFEQVDHINQIKTDNRPENLQLLSAREHQRKTQKDRTSEVQRLRAEVAAYRQQFGTLETGGN